MSIVISSSAPVDADVFLFLLRPVTERDPDPHDPDPMRLRPSLRLPSLLVLSGKSFEHVDDFEEERLS